MIPKNLSLSPFGRIWHSSPWLNQMARSCLSAPVTVLRRMTPHLLDQCERHIGVNPLISEDPIWYSGPDLAAAKLFGTNPQILQAFKLVPHGKQSGMKGTV